MPSQSDAAEVATVLRVSLGLLVRRLRQLKAEGELTVPETAALTRLDRAGPATSSELAKIEQISPQSMGVTLSALQARGLVERQRDPSDGRRVVMSLTPAGSATLQHLRDAGSLAMATAMASSFTSDELAQVLAVAPLFERLAQKI